MRANSETSEYEPVVYQRKQRSGLQISFEWLIKLALVASLFIPLVLYKLEQPVGMPAVIVATMGGVAAVTFFFARWTEGAYDEPVRRSRRQ
ncbi:MAG TPA: hypothetical protein VEJ63_01695 [Planctomycetota bacterium]|nr:hypothetical protein [Planctomycetota bacterium]